MCSKQKRSNEKMLTGMISMKCTDKMVKLCNEWDQVTLEYASKARKPWSSSQRSMNTILWPRWKKRVSFWPIPGKIFDLKWRKNSYVWTAAGVDDRIKFERVCKKLCG